MLDFLCNQLKEALRHENLRYIYELRIRAGKPVTVNKDGKYLYLTNYGASTDGKNAIICTKEELEEIVLAAGNYSVYSIEEQLKQGFITAESGERIGLGGRFVFEQGKPLTIRDFSSLCVRIPHEIIGCAELLYKECFQKEIFNTLIASE